MHGLVVTMEPFHTANAPFQREGQHDSGTRVTVCSASELEHLVTLQDTSASQLLLERQADDLQSTYALSTALTGKNLGRNLMLDAGWDSYPWKRHADLGEIGTASPGVAAEQGEVADRLRESGCTQPKQVALCACDLALICSACGPDGPSPAWLFARRMPLQCVLSGSRTLAGQTRGRTAERNNNTSARKACGADVGPARPQIAAERAKFPGASHAQTSAAWFHGPRFWDGAVLLGADRVAQQVGLGQARLPGRRRGQRPHPRQVRARRDRPGHHAPSRLPPPDPTCCVLKAGQGPRPGPGPPLPRGYGRGVWPGRR